MRSTRDASASASTPAPQRRVTQRSDAALRRRRGELQRRRRDAITLLDTGNNFGSFGAAAARFRCASRSALALDAINAELVSVDTSPGNGALTQNAAVVVSGATVVTAGNGAIALTNAGNDFGNAPGNSFSGGAIASATSTRCNTTLTSGTNQDVSVVAGGGLTLPGGDRYRQRRHHAVERRLLTTPGALVGQQHLAHRHAGVTIANDVNATGNLSLTTANSAITQIAGTIVAAGTTTVAAGVGTVALARPAERLRQRQCRLRRQRQHRRPERLWLRRRRVSGNRPSPAPAAC